MYEVACPSCAMFGAYGEEVMTPQLVLREAQVALMDWGLSDTGSPGVWSTKFGKALKSYQAKRDYPYLTTKPEYWTIYDLVEPRIGDPGFSVWAQIYQQATGRVPQAGVWQTQFALRQLKFNPGPIDGISGTKTKAAIKLWQKMHGFAQTGALAPDQVAMLAEEASEETLLGTLLVTGEAPEEQVIEEPGVTFEDPPEVVEVVEEARAARVPVEVEEDAAVTEPKVVVVREPGTQQLVAVTKIIPPKPPKEVNPWVWVGLSAVGVVGVGAVAALVVRAARNKEDF